MNVQTLIVLAVVILIIACSAYGTYRMIRDHTYCDGCPRKGECAGRNPINCTIKK